MLSNRASQLPATVGHAQIEIAPGGAHHADSNLDTGEWIPRVTRHWFLAAGTDAPRSPRASGMVRLTVAWS